MKIFVLNAGSSSHKCAVFEYGKKKPVWTGFLDWNLIKTKKSKKEVLEELIASAGNLRDVQAVGHRVVHGGETFVRPTLITPQVKEKIRELIQLAPLHNPANLEGIEIMEELFPKVPQIAVFDTAFHSHIPEYASTYPIPYDLKEEGIKRYGFHGISHEYCMNRVLEMMPKSQDIKIINCHLGNGSSLAAIYKGKSIDTTMGFTPMEGLMMGTRCGSIDPGILLYLMREKKMTLEDIDRTLNYESGMKGISHGISDMREILKLMNAGEHLASLSFDMYIHSLKGFIAKMAASLEGVDVISFTAGIGENSAEVRKKCCDGLKFLGVVLDDHKNESCAGDEEISSPESKVKVFVINTKEEFAIAEKCLTFL